ncbi:MAG: 3-deoxy-D-manno-octulosonic acid transferase [Legionellaceae bacterium]
MRYIYTSLFYLFIPFILLRLLWRGYKSPAYLKRWLERFGFIPYFLGEKGCIWIHAVSLGETLAAIPLIKALKQQYPSQNILVTTTTPTGSKQIKDVFKEEIFHVYLPYDLPGALTRFLKKVKPTLLILIELEIWPNIIHQCKKNHIPVLIINGRLSEKTAKRYGYIKIFITETFQGVTHVAVQTSIERDRFIKLGLAPQKITITGNIKFDLEIPIDLPEKSISLKKAWGINRPVWIAASTHEKEEQIILNAFATVKKHFPTLLLLLVPRHPERFDFVANLCKTYNLIRHSEKKLPTQDTDIYLGDTIGELLLFYKASDLAFVGGSLIPIGGHNVLEPAAIGIPCLTGPYTFNFLEINHKLKTANALFTVKNTQELTEQVLYLLRQPEKSKASGQRGQKFVEANKGSLQKQLNLIIHTLADKR